MGAVAQLLGHARRPASAAGRGGPRARRPRRSRSAVARPRPEAPPVITAMRARDLHARVLLSDGWVRARSITGPMSDQGDRRARGAEPARGPLDPHPGGARGPRRRPRAAPRGGGRHRGGQPASLPGQALPRADRLRRRPRASRRSARRAGSEPARARCSPIPPREALPRRRQRPRVLQAPATASRSPRSSTPRSPRGSSAPPRSAWTSSCARTWRRAGQVAAEGRLVAPAAHRGAGDVRAQRRAPPDRRCGTGSSRRSARAAARAWLEEECAALAALSRADARADPDAYLALKGTKDLDGRGLAVLRELFRERERLALELDRPPFMILGHDTLVLLGRAPAARRRRAPRDARVHGEGRAALRRRRPRGHRRAGWRCPTIGAARAPRQPRPSTSRGACAAAPRPCARGAPRARPAIWASTPASSSPSV